MLLMIKILDFFLYLAKASSNFLNSLKYVYAHKYFYINTSKARKL